MGKKKNKQVVCIEILGSIASGKTEIAKLLKDKIDNTLHVEELYGINPYLTDFYKTPNFFSYKSQKWFLKEKGKQIAKLTKKKIYLIDPSIEMDRIYAKTHRDIGWMKKGEWEKYENIYSCIRTFKDKIKSQTHYLIAKASQKVLLKRIKERIKKGGRSFEKWILEAYPEYLEALSKNVDEFAKKYKKENILIIDTQKYDFSIKENKEKLARKVTNLIKEST